jgi:hypothetical protein
VPILANVDAVGADRLSDSVFDPDATKIVLHETLTEQVFGEAMLYLSNSVGEVAHQTSRRYEDWTVKALAKGRRHFGRFEEFIMRRVAV